MEKRVLCIGDSNTYGYDPRSYFGGRYGEENRWPDLLANKSGWTILNSGENGRCIPVRDSETERFLRLIASLEPIDFILVMLGTNDLLQGVEVADAADRMESFLQKLPLKRKQIILVAPPAMKEGAWVTDLLLVGQSMELGKAYCELSKKLEIQYVDATEWETELTFDGVHLSEAGHRRFAEELWFKLK